MRICLVYDCLYPHTIGGAERWYRDIARRLVADSHEVTYLTLRQWDRDTNPGIEGVDVVAVGPRMKLYAGPGRRRILPPVVFGLGVLLHLLRHARRYDVLHTASFPYFSLLAAGALRRRGGYRLLVDWHEVWTRDYWVGYLGRLGGTIGWAVQRLCTRFRQRAFCPSDLHARRLREEGFAGPVTVLSGRYDGRMDAPDPLPAEPVVVYAGRHIPEKRVPALVPAMAVARRSAPELRARIFGDGPERKRVVQLAESGQLDDAVEVPGFVAGHVVEEAMRRALCVVLPSVREGYGLVVVEASAIGVPSVVVAAPDNAATELVEEGVNGTVAPSAAPEDLAAAILRVREAGPAMRASTIAWFRANAERLSLRRTLDVLAKAYVREEAGA